MPIRSTLPIPAAEILSMAPDSASVAATIATPARRATARRPRPAGKTKAPTSIWPVLGYSAAALAILVGWLGRAERHIFPDDGIGYWLGIAGASSMGLLLLYPIRKHVRFLHRLGSTKAWFQTHIFLGVLGPLLVLYHCNFSLGSLNSRVALFSTLLVAVSGLAGRYLYAKVHIGLSGSRKNLQQLVERARLTGEQTQYAAVVVPRLLERMNRYDRKVLEPPHTLLGAALLPMALAVKTRWARFWLTWFAYRQLRIQAASNPTIAANRPRLKRLLNRFIKEHLRRVRRVATFEFYERMFSLWHLFHLPFFYILVVAALVHVLAVHMY